MINFTTPTINLTVEGADISSMDVYVTLQQGAYELTKSGDDLTIQTETIGQVTNTNISFTLSQEESASFKPKYSVAVQVNWINENGIRSATEIKTIRVTPNLLDEVIAYESES